MAGSRVIHVEREASNAHTIQATINPTHSLLHHLHLSESGEAQTPLALLARLVASVVVKVAVPCSIALEATTPLPKVTMYHLWGVLQEL